MEHYFLHKNMKTKEKANLELRMECAREAGVPVKKVDVSNAYTCTCKPPKGWTINDFSWGGENIGREFFFLTEAFLNFFSSGRPF